MTHWALDGASIVSLWCPCGVLVEKVRFVVLYVVHDSL
jgi:hypothetical protein